MSTNTDVYSRITEEIVKQMEQEGVSWKAPWYKSKEGSLISPVNASTGNNYKGINIVSLWVRAITAGYKQGTWATYKQWSELGAQVRRGENGTLIVFYKPFEIASKAKEESQIEESSSSSTKYKMYAKMSFVFNIEQVDGYIAPEPTLNQDTRLEEVEEFFASLGAKIEHFGNRACYSCDCDKILMPKFGCFTNKESYYAVLSHELIHWTGHQNRCNRALKARFGSASYAAEELVAELGAAFLCSLLKISNEPRQDHSSYIASWLKLFKDDKKAIFTAASKAQEAVDYIERLSQTKQLSDVQKAA